MARTVKESIIIAAPGMADLGREIYGHIKDDNAHIHYAECARKDFADDEIKAILTSSVRQYEVYLLVPGHPDPNTRVMEGEQMIDASSLAEAAEIRMVMPYFPYGRGDRRDVPRTTIAAKIAAQRLSPPGRVKQFITLDLHADQIEGFFNCGVDQIWASNILHPYFLERLGDELENVVVVSPDQGGLVRATRFRDMLQLSSGRKVHIPTAAVDKHRDIHGEIERMDFYYDVTGKIVILYDDMIDTGGTLLESYRMMEDRGASKILAAAAFGLFSDKKGKQPTVDRFRDSGLEVVITNSIPRTDEFYRDEGAWLHYKSAAPTLAEVIVQSSILGGEVSKFRTIPNRY